MMDSSVPPRPPRGSGTSRDQGLARIRRLTRATVVGVVGGVAVLAGYVAHAVPGHHVSAGAASQSSSTTSVSTPVTQAPAPSAPGTASTPGTQAPAPADTLAPPPTQPQYSRSSPQVISGSS